MDILLIIYMIVLGIVLFIFFGWVGLEMEEPEPVHKRREKRKYGHNWEASEKAQREEDERRNFFDH